MFRGRGLSIDKDKNRYKKYVSFLFFEFGEWKTLLSFKFIALTQVAGSQTMHSSRTMGASISLKVDLFCVYLCLDEKRKILVMKSKVKSEADELAHAAAKYLDLPVRNHIKGA